MLRKIIIVLFLCGIIVVGYLAATRERFYSTHSGKALEYYQAGVDKMMKYYIQEGIRDMELAAQEDPKFPLPHLFLLKVEVESPKEKKEQAEWYKKLAVPSRDWTDFERGLVTLTLQKPEPGNREQMAEKINAFLQKYPTRMEAFFLLINKYQQIVESPEKLVHFYETMHRRYPNNAQILNMMGYFYAALGEKEKAKVIFEKYVFIRPNEANPYDSFGEFYYNIGDFKQAASYFRKALFRKPDFMASRIHLAKSLLYMGKVNAALALLNKIEKSDSGKMVQNSIVLLRFLCHLFTGNTAELKKLVDQLPRLNLMDSVRRSILIEYCIRNRNVECVKEILEKQEKQNASGANRHFQINRANFLLMTGNPRESAALLEKYFSAHILNSSFDIRYYVYYILIEDYMKLSDFEKAEKLANTFPPGYRAYFMMKVMSAKGDVEKALEFSRDVVRNFPGADSNFYVLREARIYAKQRNRK